jgi:phosphodiesterase/alkaline phosphatase D-like protein
MRFNAEDAERVYRRIAYGPALDVHARDLRAQRDGLSFGPETKSIGVPPGMKHNRSPFDGLQF